MIDGAMMEPRKWRLCAEKNACRFLSFHMQMYVCGHQGGRSGGRRFFFSNCAGRAAPQFAQERPNTLERDYEYVRFLTNLLFLMREFQSARAYAATNCGIGFMMDEERICANKNVDDPLK